MVTNSVAEGETDSVADNSLLLSASLFGRVLQSYLAALLQRYLS